MAVPRQSSNRTLAILYDVAYPFVEGGGQRRLFEIASRLVASGWTVDWYTLKTWDGPVVRRENGLTYHGLPGHAHLYDESGRRSAKEALSYGGAVLRAKVNFAAYDVVWCGQWPYFHLLALCLRLVPLRTAIVVDWWEMWGRHWLSYHRLLGWGGWLLEVGLANLAGRLGRIVAISEVGRRQLRSAGVPARRIAYIPNGINLREFAAIPAEAGDGDLIYFGRLKNHKNVAHVIEALAILHRQGKALRCDIIGDGPERARLEDLARNLGLNAAVTFHGAVENDRLVALLKRARIFVHPSTKEGGGSITVLEANACGLPAIFYDHPRGIDPAQAKLGETGLMASPVTPDALANAIAQMLEICEGRDVRKACTDHALAFDWDNIARQYERLFDDTIASRSSQIPQEAA